MRKSRPAARIARRAAGTIVVVAVVVGFVVLIAQLPSGTERGTLFLRGAVGAGIGLVVIVIVRRMLRSLVAAPPTPPQTIDARTSEVVYVCPVCGTRVRLELAATAKAPKHCGEEMEAELQSY